MRKIKSKEALTKMYAEIGVDFPKFTDDDINNVWYVQALKQLAEIKKEKK